MGKLTISFLREKSRINQPIELLGTLKNETISSEAGEIRNVQRLSRKRVGSKSQIRSGGPLTCNDEGEDIVCTSM